MKCRMRRGSARDSRRAGASTVEMALVAPLLFIIVFGVFEVAFAYLAQHLLQDAARQGCRVAVCQGNSNADVTAWINTLLQAESITGATITILVNSAAVDVSTAHPGDEVRVKIAVPAANVSLFPTSGLITGTIGAHCMLRHD